MARFMATVMAQVKSFRELYSGNYANEEQAQGQSMDFVIVSWAGHVVSAVKLHVMTTGLNIKLQGTQRQWKQGAHGHAGTPRTWGRDAGRRLRGVPRLIPVTDLPGSWEPGRGTEAKLGKVEDPCGRKADGLSTGEGEC